jgi:hypothetical protein
MAAIMARRWPRSLVLALACCAAAGACRGEGDAAEAGRVEVDSTNKDAMDGLSTQQIEEAAVPLSPEEAAARGIVDTTIHLENLGTPDTVEIGPPGAAPSDSGALDAARRQAGRPDAARPDSTP